MTTKGLLVMFDAVQGRDIEVERLLFEALPKAEAEPGTAAWFALRFGGHEYGVFDAFPDDAAREAHLQGRVAAAIREDLELFDGEPRFERVDVLADKLAMGNVTKGLLLRLPIKPEHRDEAAALLRDGRAIVDDEPATLAWFGLHFENGDFGVFDVFPDTKGRVAHLTGKIPQELARRGLPWLAGLPQMRFVDVLTSTVKEAIPQSRVA